MWRTVFLWRWPPYPNWSEISSNIYWQNTCIPLKRRSFRLLFRSMWTYHCSSIIPAWELTQPWKNWYVNILLILVAWSEWRICSLFDGAGRSQFTVHAHDFTVNTAPVWPMIHWCFHMCAKTGVFFLEKLYSVTICVPSLCIFTIHKRKT